jgi:energy-coupling factor transporter ATP-binding protein EcfA2
MAEKASKAAGTIKQAVKKGTGIHKKGLDAWKSKVGMNVEKPAEDEIVKVSELSNANKPQTWIMMPKAFQDVTKLPGIPENTVVALIGHSNVGKSTVMNHALVSAQQMGLIPVIIDTENAFSFQYAQSMGFKAEPIYGNVEVEEVDVETGEINVKVEKKIINWTGDFIYYNNKILAERFGDIDYQSGKKTLKKRKIAVVEDVAQAMIELLDAQDNGDINQGFLFCWDSVGSIGCFKEYNSDSKTGNPMWTAAAISQAFSGIVNDRIPRSKKISSPYNNTFLYCQKIWLSPNLVGPPTVETKGGKSLKYACRLEIQLGKTLTAGVKRLTATSGGFDYSYATQTTIKVLKNHLDAPHNVCYEGSIIATDTGLIGVKELDEYKRTHLAQILKELNKLSNNDFKAEDIEFIEEDVDVVNE